MSILLRRHMPPEVILVEVNIGLDGQGQPEYDSPIAIQAHVRRVDSQVANSITQMGGGEESQNLISIYVDAGQTPYPGLNDRLTLQDGLVCSVVESKKMKTLQDVVDHIAIKAREI